jgi:DNA-binding NarL/FixJ family response regulator
MFSSAATSGRPAVDALTARESEVLELMAQGLSNAGIGDRLHVTPKTIEVHIGSIFGKLGLLPDTVGNRRVQAVLTWLHARSSGAR